MNIILRSKILKIKYLTLLTQLLILLLTSGILQNYFVFTSSEKYINYISGTTRVDLLKANRMSEKMLNT